MRTGAHRPRRRPLAWQVVATTISAGAATLRSSARKRAELNDWLGHEVGPSGEFPQRHCGRGRAKTKSLHRGRFPSAVRNYQLYRLAAREIEKSFAEARTRMSTAPASEAAE